MDSVSRCDAAPNDGTPLVSWLLCTHVHDGQLQAALASCLSQSFGDFELLVVVNGPRCAEVAAQIRAGVRDARVRVFETHIAHLTFSLNLGLHHARGTWVARMDGDDLAYVDRLRLQLDYLAQHPDTTVLGTAYDVIDEDNRVLRRVDVATGDREIRRRLLRGNPLCHPSVVLRRDAVLAVGGYLGGIYAQDYDLWVRLAQDPRVRFANLPQACVGYRAAPVGTARRARWSYAGVAAAQFRTFAGTGQWRWGAAALLSLLKAFWRAR